MLEWVAGRWPQALDHARAAHELTDQTHHPRGLAWVGRARALIEADLGLVDDARASAAESLGFSEATSKSFFAIATLGVLGHLELALGDIAAAGSYLEGISDRLSAGGMVDPTLPVWADAIEVECALGELERARVHLELYEANADKLGSPWAIASAARCRGVLAASERDLPGAFEAFDRSLATLERHSFPFEHGRTLLCLGAVRRQGGHRRAAREALGQALADFEQLGAAPWADRVRVELGRISGRRAPSEQLTETERRVGELAARGHTNKEIAATLFMGVSTVEAHLSHVYRKLGIRRAELATRLAIPADDTAQT